MPTNEWVTTNNTGAFLSGPVTYLGTHGTTSTWDSVWTCHTCSDTISAYSHHICPAQFRTTTQPTPEEPVQDNLIDSALADELTAMRDKRDSAARYAQTKNDMASLYEAAAVFLRTQASMMYREINEGVPMTPDKK